MVNRKNDKLREW